LVLPRRRPSTTDELEAVVLHEIAHLKRRDMLVRQLQWCVGTALYFWPVVAWVNRRIDLAREQACDAFALRHGRLSVQEYARCLQRAAQPPRPWFRAYGPAAMASAPGTLERRIDMILRTKTKSTPRRLRLAGAAFLMAWSVFVLTGAVAPGADSAPGAEPVLAGEETSPDYQVVAPLIKMLNDEDADVRKWAARGLCCFMDERAIEPLIAALGDENKDVRACVIRALGSSSDERVVEPLIAAMGDKDPDIRECVVRTLGCLDDPKAKAALVKALEDEDADVREWAVRCLSMKNCSR
jgi:hypothetical protein